MGYYLIELSLMYGSMNATLTQTAESISFAKESLNELKYLV